MRTVSKALVVTVGTLLVVGCWWPSFESKSAGQIGCLPSEISVYDGESDGALRQSSNTWIAECRGRSFVCTEVITSGSTRTSQVQCSERMRDAKSPKRVPKPSESSEMNGNAGKPASRSKDGPPVSAAGFVFAQTREDAKEACVARGHSWAEISDDGGECSGAAESLGFSASVALRFCGDGICGAAIVHEPEGEWSGTIESIRAALVVKYGASREDEVVFPNECTEDTKFVECVAQGRIRIQYAWSWPSGEKLTLRIRKGEAKESPRIEIVYSRIDSSFSNKSKVRPNSSAL